MDDRAGMFVYALVFLLGVVIVQQLSALPSLSVLLALLLFSVLLYMLVNSRRKQYVYKVQYALIISCIILLLIGISYASFFAKQQLSYLLDADLAGRNLLIEGQVSGIPVSNGKVQRFEFEVTAFRVLGENNESAVERSLPRKVRLNWYYGQPVKAGEKWQLEVRLKPPHGFMNPGGFDYEAWLFQHGIDATGYIRKSALNIRQQAETKILSMAFVDYIRQLLSQRIDAIASKQPGTAQSGDNHGAYALLKALAIGDKSSISTQQWRVLTNTGTSHLMAISGLHVGLAAFFAYLLVRRIVPVFVMKRIPAQHVALAAGMFVALLYALIAGLSIPTQRAIIMLFVLSVMMLIRRNHRPLDSLGFAIVLVLLVDPLAVLSVGFWFSFSAVAVIFISINSGAAGVQQQHEPYQSRWLNILLNLKSQVMRVLKQWIRLQLLISVFLLPLSLFMFQQVSLVSPLANLLLIPYVSFLVVPVVLLAIVFSLVSQAAAAVLFNLAAGLLEIIWPMLSSLALQPYALLVQGDFDVIKLLLVTFAMLLIYFSKQLSCFIVNQPFIKFKKKTVISSVRIVAILSFIPLFFSKNPVLNSADYQLVVLDVGQGSAAVIQTQNHVLVFDAGARFSDRLDLGRSVVIPYLRTQNIRTLDRLIISHGDADHIGGAQAILDEYAETTLIGQDIENLNAITKQVCYEGMKWRWDEVDFEFLSPSAADLSLTKSDKRNNRSCVLRVSSNAGSVLFTGDIEKKTEKKLLDNFTAKLSSDVLIVPHHGSNTSSGDLFIEAVNPEISLFSVGYKNRYRLPSNKVITRYQSSGRELLRTDHSGAITVRLTESAGIIIEKYRETALKYWHHNSTPTTF